MMKTVAALALLGSAVAFAPAQQGRVNTAVAGAFDGELGAMVPVSRFTLGWRRRRHTNLNFHFVSHACTPSSLSSPTRRRRRPLCRNVSPDRGAAPDEHRDHRQ